MKGKTIFALSLSMAIFLSSMAGCNGNNLSSGNNDREEIDMKIEDLPDSWENKKELHTFYQTGHTYDPRTLLQTDYVKVCVNMGNKNVAALLDSYTKAIIRRDVAADLTVTQDVGNYYTSGRYDGKTHDDIILRKEDGSIWQFGLLPGLPYVLPTREWNDYLIDCARKAAEAGAIEIALQEIGIFGDSGYEKAFRNEWEEFYGTSWPHTLWSNPVHYFMGQHLRNFLYNRQVKQVFSSIKDEFPQVKCIIANHTSPAYYGFSNSVGNHDIAALDVVDGMEGQTWSNTIEIPFVYNGQNMARPFITGFLEYSYWANLSRQFPGKEFSFITDPKGDGYEESKTLEDCKELYKHQVISQLAFSNVYRYNSCVWPDRAYSHGYDGKPVATDAYRIIINNIVSLQTQMYKYQEPILTDNNSVNVGVMLLDTACYQAGGPGNGVNSNDFFGMVAGLMYNGLMVKAIPFGEVESKQSILNNYDIIIVGYDTMKPLSTLCNEKLENYIRGGGTVVYMGGQGAYEDLDLMWWRKAGFDSPEDELIYRLGIKATGRSKNLFGALKAVAGSQLAEKIGDISRSSSAAVGYSTIEGANALYNISEKTVAFEKQVDKGYFVFLGLDPKAFCEPKKGEDLFKLVKEISEQKLSKKFDSKKYISYKRGPVYGFSALGGDCTTDKGTFIDMFDEKLSVVNSLKVKNGQSALLLDVAEKFNSTKPVVLYAQGANPAIAEYANITRVVTAGPANTMGTIRIYIPKGYEVSAVSAKNVTNKDALVSKEFDSSTRTLLVTYSNHINKVTVDVEYVKK